MLNYTHGQILEWKNAKGQQILWMVSENPTHGMVIHSDSLIQLGTMTNLEPLKEELKPFVGSITINSVAN